jgi:hypothetical protein
MNALTAARQVVERLNDRYHLVALLPVERNRDLYVELVVAKQRYNANVVFGYLSSHGSSTGLLGSNDVDFFEPTTAKQFTNAILVMTACRADEFATKLDPACVRAVLGYKGKLLLPKPFWWEKWLKWLSVHFKPETAEKAIEMFVGALVQPVETLLAGSEASVVDAYDATLNRWHEIGNCEALNQELRHVAKQNAARLHIQGDRTATLG